MSMITYEEWWKAETTRLQAGKGPTTRAIVRHCLLCKRNIRGGVSPMHGHATASVVSAIIAWHSTILPSRENLTARVSFSGPETSARSPRTDPPTSRTRWRGGYSATATPGAPSARAQAAWPRLRKTARHSSRLSQVAQLRRRCRGFCTPSIRAAA